MVFYKLFGLCFNKIYEYIGPKIKIIKILITLFKIATLKDWAGVMPIIRAENTDTISVIPKEPGVIDIITLRNPIEFKNSELIISIFILNIL